MIVDIVKLYHLMPTRAVEWHMELGSTMDRAAELAAKDALHGTIVGAESQTDGEGRLGRKWLSRPGEGLYLTYILRKELPPHDSPALTICLGLAVAEALARHSDLRFDLRWPNDVLVNDRKVCGILVKYDKGAFLAGIGINIKQTEFPSDLATPATSLAIEGVPDFATEQFLVSLSELIDSYLDILAEEGKDKVLDLFTFASSFARGRAVEVDFGEYSERGVTDGLNEDGYLWLRLPSGERKLVVAGGVRPIPE